MASQERVTSTFRTKIRNLGFLDIGSDARDLEVGVKMELPYWLAAFLCNKRRQIVEVETPKQYRAGQREILNADPVVVDLHKLGPHFYKFGSLFLSFQIPESLNISRCLLETFQGRFKHIMDISQNCLNEDLSKVKSKLDECEKVIFALGQDSLKDFQNWQTRESAKLKASKMIIQQRKRKRNELD
ncbi:DgyrCDS106 [Dimorphilus gyrociliatus]|nr:DgyrCDS106 [Dimorphilus gyrociliatus]